MTAPINPSPIANGVKFVCLGDSITDTARPLTYQYPKALATQLLGRGVVANVTQYGYPFQEVSVIRTHVPDALASIAANPGGNNILIVEAGTNDQLHGIDLASVTTPQYNGMLSDIRADPRGANIPVICLPIFSIDETFQSGAFLVGEPATTNTNAMIAAAAAAFGCHYADTRAALAALEALYNVPAPGAAQGVFTVDKVHLNAPGASLIALTIIQKLLAITTLSPGGYSDISVKWVLAERTAMAALAAAAGTSIGTADFTTDFMDGGWTQTQTGAGQATMSATLPYGVLLVNTNGANGNVWVHPANKPVQVPNLLTGTCAAYWKGRFTANDTAAKHLVGLTAIGLGDTPAGIGFGVVGPTSSATVSGGSTTKLCTTTNAGAGDVATATTVNIDTAADHEVRLFLNGSTANWYYDGTLVSTVALTSGLVGASTAAMVTARSRNPTDATSRTLNLDRMICRR